MRRICRLRRKKDFDTLFRTGRRITFLLFRVVVRRNQEGMLRAAFVTPRTVDKRATVRNRVRRRAREWVRRCPAVLASPLDIAFIFNREAARATRPAFYDALERSMEKIIGGVR